MTTKDYAVILVVAILIVVGLEWVANSGSGGLAFIFAIALIGLAGVSIWASLFTSTRKAVMVPGRAKPTAAILERRGEDDWRVVDKISEDSLEKLRTACAEHGAKLENAS